MPIFQTIPNGFYQCNDGTYSDHNRTGACRWHGGTNGNFTQSGSGSRDFINIPLEQIEVNHNLFQNRTAPFSVRSVENIVSDAINGNFKWVNMDPVVVWKTKGRLYILSGHSRFEAFNRLATEGIIAEGKSFERIPAQIFTGTEAEAREVALNSNTLGTKETETERAQYYRNLLINGESVRNVKATAKRLEGRNANTIFAYAFLNPKGKFNIALSQFKSDDTSAKNIRDAARWVGNLRSTVGQITDSHENEIFDWLINDGWYNRLRSEKNFKDEIGSILNRRTTFGQLDERLNFKNLFSKSPVEQQFNAQLKEIDLVIKEAKKTLDAKIKELTRRKASNADIERIITPLQNAYRNALTEKTRLLSSKDDILNAAKNQKSLFDISRNQTRGSVIPILVLAYLGYKYFKS